MIYVTGDTHGRTDLLTKRLKSIKKNDVLLVAGDFGFVWDGSKQENKLLKKLSKRPILFIDGANENHSLIDSFPLVDFCGGKARHICGRMYYLLRGQVYKFGEATLFTFGGVETDADFIDRDEDAARAAQPTLEQMKEGVTSASKTDGKIDYFVTHEAPSTLRATFTDARGGALNEYLDRLMKMCKFSGWYFGCYHLDRSVAGVYHALYSRTLPLVKTVGFTVEKPRKIKEKRSKEKKK